MTECHKEQGFTLIELIVVIVILGILAVTAAPKFMNLTSDANSAVVKGLAGAIRSASQTITPKARSTGTGQTRPMYARQMSASERNTCQLRNSRRKHRICTMLLRQETAGSA